MKWLDTSVKARSIGGYFAVLGIIVLGLVFIMLTPSFERLEFQSGQLSKFWGETPLIIILDNSETEYYVYLIKDQRKLNDILPNAKRLEIWTRSGKNIVKQLKVDSKMVIEYNWWNEIKFPGVIILVGLILLPFVKREQQKENLELGKTKKTGYT